MLSLGSVRASLRKNLLQTRVSVWLVCVSLCLTTFTQLPSSWPVRTLSFSHDSQMIASASEDLFIDIVSHCNHYTCVPRGNTVKALLYCTCNCTGLCSKW